MRLFADPVRAALLVGALGIVIHAGSLANGFAYDDDTIVAGDSGIHTLAALPARLAQPYWPSTSGSLIGNWRPLTTGLFGLTWAASGGSPVVFHLVAIVLHGVATALVVLLLAQLMAAEAAALGGLLFAVHPVHVEAVANVVGTAEPLAAILLLTAALVHLGAGERLRLPRALGVACLYALAIMAKEGAVVLPLFLLLLDASRTELGGRRLWTYVRDRGPLYLLLAAVLAVSMIARWTVLGRALAAPAPPGAEALLVIPRIWTVAQVWPHYLRLLLVPFDLSADYAPAVVPIAFGWTPLGVAGVITALVSMGGAWLAWRRGAPLAPGRGSARVVGLAILWTGTALLPVANVLFLSNIFLAERTLYMASVGAAGALGWILVELSRERPRVVVAAVVGVTLAFTAVSVRRVRVWRDTDTVMSTLLDEHPGSGRAWLAFGHRLAEQRSFPEARRAYGISIGLLNSDYQVSTDVASRLMAMDRPASARFLLKRAWKDHPEWSTAPGLLAAVELGEGRYTEAAAAARAGALLSPSNASMYHLLAQALTGLDRPEEAVRARAAALRHGFPRRGRLWILQALDLGKAGDTLAAVAALDSASLEPLSPQELQAWSEAQAALGRSGSEDARSGPPGPPGSPGPRP